MPVIEIRLITAAVALFASGKTYQPMMTGGVVLLVIAWLVHWGYDRRLLRPTKLDWPLRLFVVSGLISLWVTHDLGTSLAKFWLIVGSIALYYALTHASLKIRFSFAAGLIGFAALLALYFITQNNDIAAIGANKFPLLTDLHATLRALSPQLNLYQPHPNLVAGVLEVALIIGVGLILITFQAWPMSSEAEPFGTKSLPLQIGLILLVALIALAFLLTGSRGGWLAVAVAGFGWFLTEMRHSSRLRTLDSLAVLIILGSVVFLLVMQLNDPAESQIATEASSISRLTLYQGSSQLVRDYVFTGAGLGSFPMLYSAYV
ncbi:MAG: O-antigen ligase family protein, partial [Anaerolineae bacterium]|nr:O-antigen ligase family protein [Anaerolineae bacterium]